MPASAAPARPPSSDYGEEFMAWEYPVRQQYHRGFWWYVGMLGLGALLLLYAVASANFLFALIILMFSLVLYLSSISVPELRRFAITEEGVISGEEFYPYKDIRAFWFAYDPPEIKTLYLSLRSGSKIVGVHLAEQNPSKIRAVLERSLKEDLAQDGEPFIDTLSRLLKV